MHSAVAADASIAGGGITPYTMDVFSAALVQNRLREARLGRFVEAFAVADASVSPPITEPPHSRVGLLDEILGPASAEEEAAERLKLKQPDPLLSIEELTGGPGDDTMFGTADGRSRGSSSSFDRRVRRLRERDGAKSERSASLTRLLADLDPVDDDDNEHAAGDDYPYVDDDDDDDDDSIANLRKIHQARRGGRRRSSATSMASSNASDVAGGGGGDVSDAGATLSGQSAAVVRLRRWHRTAQRDRVLGGALLEASRATITVPSSAAASFKAVQRNRAKVQERATFVETLLEAAFDGRRDLGSSAVGATHTTLTLHNNGTNAQVAATPLTQQQRARLSSFRERSAASHSSSLSALESHHHHHHRQQQQRSLHQKNPGDPNRLTVCVTGPSTFAVVVAPSLLKPTDAEVAAVAHMHQDGSAPNARIPDSGFPVASFKSPLHLCFGAAKSAKHPHRTPEVAGPLGVPVETFAALEALLAGTISHVLRATAAASSSASAPSATAARVVASSLLAAVATFVDPFISSDEGFKLSLVIEGATDSSSPSTTSHQRVAGLPVSAYWAVDEYGMDCTVDRVVRLAASGGLASAVSQAMSKSSSVTDSNHEQRIAAMLAVLDAAAFIAAPRQQLDAWGTFTSHQIPGKVAARLAAEDAALAVDALQDYLNHRPCASADHHRRAFAARLIHAALLWASTDYLAIGSVSCAANFFSSRHALHRIPASGHDDARSALSSATVVFDCAGSTHQPHTSNASGRDSGSGKYGTPWGCPCSGDAAVDCCACDPSSVLREVVSSDRYVERMLQLARGSSTLEPANGAAEGGSLDGGFLAASPSLSVNSGGGASMTRPAIPCGEELLCCGQRYRSSNGGNSLATTAGSGGSDRTPQGTTEKSTVVLLTVLQCREAVEHFGAEREVLDAWDPSAEGGEAGVPEPFSRPPIERGALRCYASAALANRALLQPLDTTLCGTQAFTCQFTASAFVAQYWCTTALDRGLPPIHDDVGQRKPGLLLDSLLRQRAQPSSGVCRRRTFKSRPISVEVAVRHIVHGVGASLHRVNRPTWNPTTHVDAVRDTEFVAAGGEAPRDSVYFYKGNVVVVRDFEVFLRLQGRLATAARRFAAPLIRAHIGAAVSAAMAAKRRRTAISRVCVVVQSHLRAAGSQSELLDRVRKAFVSRRARHIERNLARHRALRAGHADHLADALGGAMAFGGGGYDGVDASGGEDDDEEEDDVASASEDEVDLIYDSEIHPGEDAAAVEARRDEAIAIRRDERRRANRMQRAKSKRGKGAGGGIVTRSVVQAQKRLEEMASLHLKAAIDALLVQERKSRVQLMQLEVASYNAIEGEHLRENPVARLYVMERRQRMDLDARQDEARLKLFVIGVEPSARHRSVELLERSKRRDIQRDYFVGQGLQIALQERNRRHTILKTESDHFNFMCRNVHLHDCLDDLNALLDDRRLQKQLIDLKVDAERRTTATSSAISRTTEEAGLAATRASHSFGSMVKVASFAGKLKLSLRRLNEMRRSQQLLDAEIQILAALSVAKRKVIKEEQYIRDQLRVREARERHMASFFSFRREFYREARRHLLTLSASFRVVTLPVSERERRHGIFFASLVELCEAHQRYFVELDEIRTMHWLAHYEDVERRKILHELAQWDLIFDDKYASPTKLLHRLLDEQRSVRGMLTTAAAQGVDRRGPQDIVAASLARGDYTPATDVARSAALDVLNQKIAAYASQGVTTTTTMNGLARQRMETVPSPRQRTAAPSPNRAVSFADPPQPQPTLARRNSGLPTHFADRITTTNTASSSGWSRPQPRQHVSSYPEPYVAVHASPFDSAPRVAQLPLPHRRDRTPPPSSTTTTTSRNLFHH